MQPLLDGVRSDLVSSERQVVAHDTAQTAGSPQVELVPASARLLVNSAFKSRTTDVFFFFFRIHLRARWGTEPYVALHKL